MPGFQHALREWPATSTLGFCSAPAQGLLSGRRSRRAACNAKPPVAAATVLNPYSTSVESLKQGTFASLRKLVVALKQKGQLDASRSMKVKWSEILVGQTAVAERTHDSVSTTVHGLRLGRSLHYRYQNPHSARTALICPALRLVGTRDALASWRGVRRDTTPRGGGAPRGLGGRVGRKGLGGGGWKGGARSSAGELKESQEGGVGASERAIASQGVGWG